MSVSSRVVSRTPRSSSPESSRSQSSRGNRAQTAKTSAPAPIAASAATASAATKSAPKAITKKTKTVPLLLAPASPPKSVRAKPPVAAKSTVETPVAKLSAVAVDTTRSTSVRDTTVLDKPNLNAPKVKRTRVPADLAERYGENRKERKIAEAAPVAEKKARKTAEQREKLRQLMTPDDDILQRLARAAAGSSRPAPRQKKATRSKAEWESRCGKCGVTAVFSTPAALCAKCGAITVRVLD